MIELCVSEYALLEGGEMRKIAYPRSHGRLTSASGRALGDRELGELYGRRAGNCVSTSTQHDLALTAAFLLRPPRLLWMLPPPLLFLFQSSPLASSWL